jgi:hypothetical protein
MSHFKKKTYNEERNSLLNYKLLPIIAHREYFFLKSGVQ